MPAISILTAVQKQKNIVLITSSLVYFFNINSQKHFNSQGNHVCGLQIHKAPFIPRMANTQKALNGHMTVTTGEMQVPIPI